MTIEANFTPLSPVRFLERSAAVFPDRIAVIDGDRRYTYRDFAWEVERIAHALRCRIAPGDRVAYLCLNTPELLFAHFAVPLAGGVLVALNTRLSADEVEYILEHSGAAVLFVDSELTDLVSSAYRSVPTLREVVVITDPDIGVTDVWGSVGMTDYADFCSVADNLDKIPLRWGVVDEQQMISINYTSGTTGRPKGVMYSHRGSYLSALGGVIHNGFSAATKYLWTLPMFHCNGWCMPWAVTAAGGAHVCLRAVRAPEIWDAIDKLGVTHLSGAPFVCATIAAAPQAHPVGALQIMTGGAPPSPTVIAKLAAINIEVVHAYGLTEVYGPYTICEPQEWWSGRGLDEQAALLSRQGVAMVQAENVRVVDAEMNDVPADGTTVGEIVLRGNNVMLGYYRDPAATADAFSGQWFNTGDLAVMHSDSYIQIKDRAKDIVISGGENISTVEIEQAIVSHPSVLDVAVIGVPDVKWGERPKAFVILRDGHSVTPSQLAEHIARSLAKFKVPDEFAFLTELPRTSTGKVRKHELRSGA